MIKADQTMARSFFSSTSWTLSTILASMTLVTLLTGIMPEVDSFQSCPSICICKWKNGKRWMECRDQGQISIPDKLDIETQVLDLSGNNLQILPREVFARHGMVNLQRLHLANCKIGQIDPTAFRGLTNLVELNLAGNLLTAVPTATFADIPYLRELRLNDNPLQKLEANAFEMIPQLVSLDLTNCNIKKIAAKAFANLNHLEKLYLSNNSIKELRQKAVESLTGLHGIELSGNPWSCDCRLRALKEWIVTANVPHTIEPTCASPPRLENKQFAELSVEEFACPPDLLSAPRFVEANAGENATIVCKIGSVPKSSVRWYREGNEVLNNSLSNRGLQRFLIFENGTFEGQSTLILTNVKTDDSGQYKCVASNPAGKVEANFTLQVGYFVGGVASLESSEIAGIAVTFTVVAVVILVVVLVFLVRQRSCTSPFSAATSDGRQKRDAPTNGDANNGFVNGNGSTTTITNPVQKPPRLTDLHQFNATGQLSSNGSLTINGTVFHPNNGESYPMDRPIGNSTSNPDLIPPSASGNISSSIRREDSGEDLGGFSPTRIVPSPSRRVVSVNNFSPQQQPLSPAMPSQRPQNRHVIRPTPQHAVPNVIPNMLASNPLRQLGSDSYYPDDRPDYVTRPSNGGPNMWVEDSPHHRSSSSYLVPSSPSMSPMRRDNKDYSTRTLGPMNGPPSYPGIGGSSPFRQRASATKTLPRFLHSTPINNINGGGPSSFAQSQSSSLYLSEWHGAVSEDFANPLRDYGYPSDYGLPVTGDGGSVTINPMTDLLYSEESDIVGGHVVGGQQQQQLNLSNSSGSSSTLSPLRSGTGGHLSSSGLGDTSTASGTSTTIMMGYDHPSDVQAIMTSSGGSGGTPTPTSGASRNSTSWLKHQGGVQVLPSSVSPRTVSAKPRLFKTANRDSPDEGIQDDCSTDV